MAVHHFFLGIKEAVTFTPFTEDCLLTSLPRAWEVMQPQGLEEAQIPDLGSLSKTPSPHT